MARLFFRFSDKNLLALLAETWLYKAIILTPLNLFTALRQLDLSSFFIDLLYIRITAFIIMVLTTETFETNGAFGSQQD